MIAKNDHLAIDEIKFYLEYTAILSVSELLPLAGHTDLVMDSPILL